MGGAREKPEDHRRDNEVVEEEEVVGGEGVVRVGVP